MEENSSFFPPRTPMDRSIVLLERCSLYRGHQGETLTTQLTVISVQKLKDGLILCTMGQLHFNKICNNCYCM